LNTQNKNGKATGASSCFLTYPTREETSSAPAPAPRGSELPSPAADGEEEERGGGVKTGSWNAKTGAGARITGGVEDPDGSQSSGRNGTRSSGTRPEIRSVGRCAPSVPPWTEGERLEYLGVPVDGGRQRGPATATVPPLSVRTSSAETHLQCHPLLSLVLFIVASTESPASIASDSERNAEGLTWRPRYFFCVLVLVEKGIQTKVSNR
jgi:hypothetical protein